MRVRSLASGSKGNCLAVRGGGVLLLIDCGISCREISRRMAQCGASPDDVDGVLLTHDHSDHCAGLATFHRRHPRAALYANGNTADAIASITGVEDGWSVFETAEPFEVGGLRVTSFSVPHDAADPVGYLIEEGGTSLFVGTDMGIMTVAAKEALSRATCAVLEANHDPELLQTSDRPVSLKQRIAGRCGHLSNCQAADALREASPAGLRFLLLAHLSQQCNADYLAREAVGRALADVGLSGVVLEALPQDEPGPLVDLDAGRP